MLEDRHLYASLRSMIICLALSSKASIYKITISLAHFSSTESKCLTVMLQLQQQEVTQVEMWLSFHTLCYIMPSKYHWNADTNLITDKIIKYSEKSHLQVLTHLILLTASWGTTLMSVSVYRRVHDKGKLVIPPGHRACLNALKHDTRLFWKSSCFLTTFRIIIDD